MNRIDRLAALLIYLQSRPLVKAQDVSEKFSISLRTVYRDIKALEQAGVPIIGEAGSGYKIMEGYRLPPVMFTDDEASALLTASKFMQAMAVGPCSLHYISALDKIRAILRHSEKQHIADLDKQIEVVRHAGAVYEQPAELHLPTLLKAIAACQVLQIDYGSIEGEESRQRKVEPVGIYYQGNHWYLVAFCQLRNDYRVFRTDKIISILFTGKSIINKHPPLQNFTNQTAEKKQMHKVVLEMNKETAKYFGNQKYYNGFLKQQMVGQTVRMTFLTCSLTGFARWFMLFGDSVDIVEPPELKVLAYKLAEKIIKKLECWKRY